LPQPTEGPAQAREGHFGPPQAPVGALAPMKQQLPTSKPQRGRKPGEQKSIGQSDQQEHFAPRLPALQSQGFDEQFAFLKTETFLNFPTGCATSCSAALIRLGSILPGSDVLCYM